MIIKVSDIMWDTDGETVDLPKEVEIPECELEPNGSISDEIADFLSDTYGFCVEGFYYQTVDSYYQLLVFDTETDKFYSFTETNARKALNDGFSLFKDLVVTYEEEIDREDVEEYKKMSLENFANELTGNGELCVQCHFSHIAFQFSKVELPVIR